MRTLIYKRTHSGDPDPTSGLFGVHDCMRRDRARMFDAVIGVGGSGDEPRRSRIAGKLTWVGIMTVEAREPITVPAGTFQAFNAVCRNKKTGAPRYSAWYSPEVKQLVKLQENLDTGTRVRELIAFNL